MNPRVTVVLAAFVAALAAFIWFWEIEGADRRTEAEAAQKRLFPELEATTLTAIELQTSEGRQVRLENEGGWRLTEPLAFPADGPAVEGLAAALAGLQSEAVYDDPEPLANYGLDGEPNLRGFAGEEAFEVRIGNATPSGSNTYVALPGDPRVFTVTSFRLGAVQKSLEDLREKRVADFDRAAVTGVEVAWQGSRMALEKTEKSWSLTHPLEAPADEAAVDDLLSDLGFLRAEGFIDEPGAEVEAALSDPAMSVLLRGEGGATLAELHLGPRNAEDRRPMRGREGFVYEISNARFDDLPQTVTAFRFKELAKFAEADVGAFELEFDAAGEVSRVSAEASEGGGFVTTPDTLAEGRAQPIVEALSGLKAIAVLAETMGPEELAELGLAPPAARLRIFGHGERGARATLADVSLGSPQAGRGIPAQRAGDPVIYWLDEAIAEQVPVSRDAFQNRFVAAPNEELEEGALLGDEPESGAASSAAAEPAESGADESAAGVGDPSSSRESDRE